MWKSLNPGEIVLVGDTIRYKSETSDFTHSKDKIYNVVEADVHYFKIALDAGKETGETSDHRIIKYMDVGYHLGFEIWTEESHGISEDTDQLIIGWN
ncbi:MAG TPA: hypothetical protein VNV85_17295 [Puia sp.]|jgi:hypothetical protein|nr:hypothetical protein [Puia sp.]